MIQKIKMLIRAFRYRTHVTPNEISFVLKNTSLGDTVIDIGANKGGFLYWMIHKVGRKGKVIAFEPQNFLYDYLRKYFSGKKYQEVKIEPYALSDKEDIATMIIPDNGKNSNPGASIHFTLNDSPSARVEKVTTTTLDRYCESNNLQPVLIKIDVEGHEFKVIKGGLKTLANYKPKIILECEATQVGSDKVKETFDQLLLIGYKGHFFFKDKKCDILDFESKKHHPETFVGKKGFDYVSNFFFY